MAKALKEYKEIEIKLGNENTNLKSKLNDLQDDFFKMEEYTRGQLWYCYSYYSQKIIRAMSLKYNKIIMKCMFVHNLWY